MRDIKYLCGCNLSERGIKVCTLHLVIFEDLLKGKDYNRFGWDVNQKTYDKIFKFLNQEEKDRLKKN